MEACNAYYYATRDPLGAGGDFTTAPTISPNIWLISGAVVKSPPAPSGSRVA